MKTNMEGFHYQRSKFQIWDHLVIHDFFSSTDRFSWRWRTNWYPSFGSL